MLSGKFSYSVYVNPMRGTNVQIVRVNRQVLNFKHEHTPNNGVFAQTQMLSWNKAVFISSPSPEVLTETFVFFKNYIFHLLLFSHFRNPIFSFGYIFKCFIPKKACRSQAVQTSLQGNSFRRGSDQERVRELR